MPKQRATTDKLPVDPATLPPLLTVKQAAQLANVSTVYLCRLCREGKIKAARIGKSWRIGRDAFLADLNILGLGYKAAAGATSLSGDTVEIVIRVEIPAELAKQLAQAKISVITSENHPR